MNTPNDLIPDCEYTGPTLEDAQAQLLATLSAPDVSLECLTADYADALAQAAAFPGDNLPLKQALASDISGIATDVAALRLKAQRLRQGAQSLFEHPACAVHAPVNVAVPTSGEDEKVAVFDPDTKAPKTRLDFYVETLGELEGRLKDLIVTGSLLVMHAAELPDDEESGLGPHTAQSESANIVALLVDTRRRVQALLTAEVRNLERRVLKEQSAHEAAQEVLKKTKEFVTDASVHRGEPAVMSDDTRRHLERAESLANAADVADAPQLPEPPAPTQPVPVDRRRRLRLTSERKRSAPRRPPDA